jgi:hypothetical protein
LLLFHSLSKDFFTNPEQRVIQRTRVAKSTNNYKLIELAKNLDGNCRGNDHMLFDSSNYSYEYNFNGFWIYSGLSTMTLNVSGSKISVIEFLHLNIIELIIIF